MDGGIGTDSLILTVDQNPKTELPLGDFEVLRDTLLKGEEVFGLQHSEGGQLGSRQVLVVEGSKIETLVAREDVIGDDLGGEVEVLLVLLPSLCLKLLSFRIKTSLYLVSAQSHDSGIAHLLK